MINAFPKIETNAEPNTIGSEAQASWATCKCRAKVRNKNETAKLFDNFILFNNFFAWFEGYSPNKMGGQPRNY